MATRTTSKPDPVTASITRGGLALIAPGTPLTRLHYFDGKRLRAADLTHEQSALRSWLMLSNQAGGAGVVHGFDCHLTGDRLDLGRGLAIDPAGRLLLLPDAAAISIATLLDAARGDRDPTPPRPKSGRFTPCEPVRVQPPGVTVEHVELWLLTLSHAEAACGSEDVFGDPCERACVSSTDRPYLVEGVLLRAVPLALKTPLPTASAVALTRLHLRSQIAAAYFADDRRRVPSLISGPGLRAEAWCLGSQLVGGTDVPIAVLARAAGETLFLDPWIPRRERIEPPPRQHWAARMAMRPWSGFLAEVLQFQCQLRDLLAEDPKRSPADPCARTRATLRRTSDEVRQLLNHYSAVSERLLHGRPDDPQDDLKPDLNDALARLKRLQLDLDADHQRDAIEPLDRLLIHGGIIELPAAGYLPVQPGRDVELQVRRWLGDGVDLRFCIVRPDFVAHALEEAQHLDRISLLTGLDDPKAKPELDILVPDGQRITATRGVGVEFSAESRLHTRRNPDRGAVPLVALPALRAATTASGAGRAERLQGGGAALHIAGQIAGTSAHNAATAAVLAAQHTPAGLRGFLSATIDRHPADAARGERIPLHIRLVTAGPKPTSATLLPLLDLDLDGSLHITAIGPEIHADFEYTPDTGPSVTQPLVLTWQPARPGLLAAHMTLTRQGPPAVTIDLRLEWSATDPHDLTATLVATSTAPNNPHQLVTEVHARFTENPAVLAPPSPAHTAALTILDDLTRAHDDPGLRSEALALLFPPRPTQTDLLATRDWVLFHRRRSKQCIATPKPAPLRPPVYRTYRVYAALLDGRRPALPVLLAGLDPRSFVELGTTRFLANADDLLPLELAALEGIRPLLPPGFNVLGAASFSAHADQDGEPRLTAQTRAVARILTPRPPEAPELFVHLLAQPPANTSLQGIDGLIILAGLPRTASTRANVYWVDPRQLAKLKAASNLASFLKTSKSLHLGTVAYTDGTPHLLDADPTTLSKALNDAPSFRTAPHDLVALAFCATDHPTDADPALLAERAKSLATALSLNDRLRDATGHLKPTAQFPPNTPIAVLLSARPS